MLTFEGVRRVEALAVKVVFGAPYQSEFGLGASLDPSPRTDHLSGEEARAYEVRYAIEQVLVRSGNLSPFIGRTM